MRLFWFSVAAAGGYLWWRSRQAQAASLPPLQPKTTTTVKRTSEPALPVYPEEYDVIPGSNYAYTGSGAEGTLACVDAQNGMSVPIDYCTFAFTKYTRGY